MWPGIVPIIYLVVNLLCCLVAVGLLLGAALVAIAVALGCGWIPLWNFYDSLFHLCGSVLPLFYRDPRRAALCCVFLNYYCLLLLWACVKDVSRNLVKLSALFCLFSLCLIRRINSPLKAVTLYRVVSM